MIIMDVSILGTSKVTGIQLTEFAKKYSKCNCLYKIAVTYITVGKKYGIRGDIAFCQALLETGYFNFTGGTAMRLTDYNFCGLGVLKLGTKGNTFGSVKEGVTAHIQHLYAYATTKDLPKGEELVDIRFKYVKRGTAPTWKKLGGKWASNKEYGEKILAIYNKVV